MFTPFSQKLMQDILFCLIKLCSIFEQHKKQIFLIINIPQYVRVRLSQYYLKLKKLPQRLTFLNKK